MTWPGNGVPNKIEKLLEFIHVVYGYHRESINQHNSEQVDTQVLLDKSPICCMDGSNGNENAAVFCVIDICINRLHDKNLKSINDIVKQIRLQKPKAVLGFDQYVLIHKAILKYEKNLKRL